MWMQDHEAINRTHMEEKTPREPLLSDAELSVNTGESGDEEMKLRLFNKVREVRDFYEDMITTGDLRLIGDVTISGRHITIGTCSRCSAVLQKQFAYCPVCGCDC